MTTPPVYASFARRLGAIIIDTTLLILVLIIPCLLIMIPTIMSITENSDTAVVEKVFPVLITVSIVLNLVYFAYFIIFTFLRGQTIGKMTLGIKVVKDLTIDSKLTLRSALMRELIGRGVLGFIPLYGIIDYLWPLWDPQKQALHDKIAGTIVIKV